MCLLALALSLSLISGTVIVRLRSANAMTDAMLPRALHTLDQFTHSLDSPVTGNCERGGHECGWCDGSWLAVVGSQWSDGGLLDRM